jgi:hypothetical protein
MNWRTTAQSMTRCNPIQIILTHGSPSLLRAKKPPSMARPEWGNCYDPAALAAGSDDYRRVQRLPVRAFVHATAMPECFGIQQDGRPLFLSQRP